MSKNCDILQRGTIKSLHFQRLWVLYPPIWKRPDRPAVGLSSLTSNCGHEDKKQIEKCSSAMHICFIIWVIID